MMPSELLITAVLRGNHQALVIQYELDKALFDNKIKLSNQEYLRVLQSVRQLQQDNDINAFRNEMERVTGKSSFATDMLRRLIMALRPSANDRLFNPK